MIEFLEDRIVPSTVYSNDFQSTVGSEWSNTTTSTTPVGSRQFLGDFSNQTVSLTLNDLPTHTTVTVTFDLFILRSWDGNNPEIHPVYGSLGPDVWDLGVSGGPTLLHTTFSNHQPDPNPPSDRQAFPGPFPGGDNAADTGAVEVNTLGYYHPVITSIPMDSVYHLTFTFDHTAGSVTLNFSASGLQDISDESWGLDNVQVSTAIIAVTPPNCGCDCPPPNASVNKENPNAYGGNPASTGTSANPVRYFDGTAFVNAVDLSSWGFGADFGQARTWTNQPAFADLQANDPQAGQVGAGWVLSQQPWLIQDDTTVIAVMDANKLLFFDADGGGYQARFFVPDTLTHDDTSHTFTLVDSIGDLITFHDFSSSVPAEQQGQFLSLTDPAGNVTSVTSTNADGTIAETQRTDAATGLTESYLYTYETSGPNAGLLTNVTLRRQETSSGPWTIVRQVAYTYYDGTQSYGNIGDLMTATIEDADGNALDTSYYRYYTASDAGSVGYVHGLKYVFNPASYARLVAAVGDPFTATDTAVAPFADNAFQYDAQQRVTQEIVQGEGCSCTTEGGQGTYSYSYATAANPDGYNYWKHKTVKTLPDGNENIVYTNVYGEVMLYVFHDVSTDQEWETYTQYDSKGRITLVAMPSALSGFDENAPDLLNNQDGNYEFLNDDTGLIQTITYYTATTAGETTAGGVAGYEQSVSLQRGEFGTSIPQSTTEYFLHTAGGATIAPAATVTVYRNDDGTGAETTSFGYTFFSGSTRIQSLTTTLPLIDASQNGPGTPDVSDTVFDENARPIWMRDADGFLTYMAYDEATGALTKVIQDVDTTQTGDFADLPSGWSTPAGGGLHLTTTIEVDDLGRQTKLVDPNGNITYTVYNDPNHEVRVYAGWDSATDRPTGPTQVYREDRPGSYFETLTMSAAPDVDGSGRPTGTEAISDIQTLSRTYISNGGQVSHVDDYFLIESGIAADSSFETPNVGTGSYSDFQYNPTDSPWTFTAGAGVAGNGSGFTSGNPNAPAGTQVAFLQDAGSTISQAVSFTAGTYTISFLAAQRQNYQPAGPQTIEVLVDGAVVSTLTPTSINYGLSSTASFTVTAGVHNVAFRGTTSGDSTAFLDEVTIQQLSGISASDPGFETPNVGTGSYGAFAYNPATSPWTFNSGSGVAGNGSGFTSGNPDAPEGTQVGFLQSDASSISQSVTFAAGTYAIGFFAAQRGNYQPAGAQAIEVLVGGNVVGTFTPAGTGYTLFTTDSFTVTAGAHTLAFQGLTSGDSTAFIDQVSVQTVSSVTYSTAPDIGTINVNFYRTTYGYDDRGRPNAVQTPNGTIYRTVYDGLSRAVSTWIGTNDTPTNGEDWAPDNNTGTANMIQVSANVYDNGGVGDSNLTQITAFPGGSDAPRVTESFFDWRDRLVATKGGVQGTEDTATHRPIVYVVYDNLSEAVELDQYDGDGVSMVDADNDGVPDKPAASLLRAQSTIEYDELGRAFRTHVFNVSPSDGTVSTSSLTSNYFFDHRGNLIEAAEPGGLVSKAAFDGVGRLVVGYLTDGGSGTDWAAANTVSGDIVLSQQETQYDANGNPILMIDRERFHDESATGALGDATTGPLARVNFVAAYFDALDRVTATVNVGTNGGTAYTRPSTVPSRSDTVLVSSYQYNDAGWLRDVQDSRGIDNRTLYDNLGRTRAMIDAFTDGVPANDTNRTTAYAYDGNNNLLTVEARLPAGATQTTQYLYGVTTADGSAVNSNDLMAATIYPDPATGQPSSDPDQKETYTYNALGQAVTTTDRNGTTHTYSYDVLGRLISDTVTTLGAGVDGSVRRLDIAYDTQGNAFLFTSYADTAGTTIVNQTQRQFNGLGQLIAEYQSHDGPVVIGTTPVVQYAYSEMSGGANNSRLVSMTYPNGRVINYNYAAGLDDSISRLSSLSDTSGTLEAYDYLGLNTLVRRAHPEMNADLTYISQTTSTGDAGDKYTGLDRFGRIVEQAWIDTLTGQATDDFTYSYDRDSNVTARTNLLDAAFSEGYTYDQLNRLTSFSRADGHSQDWSLDAQGNFDSVNTDSTPEDRTHNAQNEIQAVGAASMTYDNNGNLTTDERGQTLVYDAWDRLVEVKNSGGSTLTTYAYDAFGRRITENPGTLRHLYYSAAWQVIEERVATSTNADVQHVWCPCYVDALVLRDRDTTGSGTLDERLYVQQDANYNVTALIDTSGSVVERNVYDPYGQVTVLDASWNVRTGGSSYSWVYLYQGLRRDFTVGLDDNRWRFYSFTMDVFVGQDPLRYTGGQSNFYERTGDNPLNWNDSSGLDRYNDSDYVHGYIVVDVWRCEGGKWKVVGQRRFDFALDTDAASENNWRTGKFASALYIFANVVAGLTTGGFGRVSEGSVVPIEEVKAIKRAAERGSPMGSDRDQRLYIKSNACQDAILLAELVRQASNGVNSAPVYHPLFHNCNTWAMRMMMVGLSDKSPCKCPCE